MALSRRYEAIPRYQVDEFVRSPWLQNQITPAEPIQYYLLSWYQGQHGCIMNNAPINKTEALIYALDIHDKIGLAGFQTKNHLQKFLETYQFYQSRKYFTNLSTFLR